MFRIGRAPARSGRLPHDRLPVARVDADRAARRGATTGPGTRHRRDPSADTGVAARAVLAVRPGRAGRHRADERRHGISARVSPAARHLRAGARLVRASQRKRPERADAGQATRGDASGRERPDPRRAGRSEPKAASPSWSRTASTCRCGRIGDGETASEQTSSPSCSWDASSAGRASSSC